MQEYEIRVLDDHGAVVLSATGRYHTDMSAIRAAERLCRAGESVEVSSGDARIFAGLPRPKNTIVWPVTGALEIKLDAISQPHHP